jgi:hypothetical protein
MPFETLIEPDEVGPRCSNEGVRFDCATLHFPGGVFASGFLETNAAHSIALASTIVDFFHRSSARHRSSPQ